ncbi:hypothetical protein UFOVP1290_373 [uncultured Caudovirales phage]|uniref:Uncharacterized protein n=1 Tax=uncultured Caudovirales phage TaxID=2100421 RepID=A0A6J5RHJ2_9CAUD|nr:hypothetical protein UFOVP1290_373 [uncultured Caudovirales phage]
MKTKQMVEVVESILKASHSAVEAMADGDRTQVKELAKTVALSLSMEPKHVLSFVDYYVHNSDVVYVSRGKNGGVVRGTKPAKTDKPVKKVDKKVKADDSTLND